MRAKEFLSHPNPRNAEYPQVLHTIFDETAVHNVSVLGELCHDA
jgi:hypothetical protein